MAVKVKILLSIKPFVIANQTFSTRRPKKVCSFSLKPIDKSTKSYYNPFRKYDFILLEDQNGNKDLQQDSPYQLS